jgi:hypothetical protein
MKERIDVYSISSFFSFVSFPVSDWAGNESKALVADAHFIAVVQLGNANVFGRAIATYNITTIATMVLNMKVSFRSSFFLFFFFFFF